MGASKNAGKNIPQRISVGSSQLATIVKDLRLAKLVKMDLDAGMHELALKSLKERRLSEADRIAKKAGWFSDAINAICSKDIPKAIIIVADVAWIRQAELDMLNNVGSQ